MKTPASMKKYGKEGPISKTGRENQVYLGKKRKVAA